MTRNPTDIPSVEQRDDDNYFCGMCSSFFDSEAFELAGDECPGCARMREAEQNIRGAL